MRSPTRDWNLAPCIGSMESSSLDCQWSACIHILGTWQFWFRVLRFSIWSPEFLGVSVSPGWTKIWWSLLVIRELVEFVFPPIFFITRWSPWITWDTSFADCGRVWSSSCLSENRCPEMPFHWLYSALLGGDHCRAKQACRQWWCWWQSVPSPPALARHSLWVGLRHLRQENTQRHFLIM